MFRGAKQTKREGTDGEGEDIEKLELPEVVRREDTVRCSPERSHHLGGIAQRVAPGAGT